MIKRYNMLSQTLKLAVPALIAATLICSCTNVSKPSPNRQPAIPSDPEIEAAVKRTLSSMTLEEKVGQMVQMDLGPLMKPDMVLDMDKVAEMIDVYKVGSFLNLPYSRATDHETMASLVKQLQDRSMEVIGIPTVFGLDMNHGTSYISDGTLFPQPVNIAATFDLSNAVAMGESTAYETRATLVPYVFNPTMDLTRTAAWPRVYESWGEDPYLSAQMASSLVRALQGPDPNHVDKYHVGTSIKHYMAYGAPLTGKDRTPAYVPDSELRDKFFRPFKECIEAGALTMMVNSSSINGVPVHSSHKLLTEWVKEGLNWDGMIISDWADVNNLFTREKIAADRKEALVLAINAGVDMIMDPYDPAVAADIIELVESGLLSKSRIDDAVSRILRFKYRLGLFEEPSWDVREYTDIRCRKFVEASYKAALESEVLLKNDGILPIRKGSRILVTGPNSNSVRCLDGGWAYTWQGSNDPVYVDGFNTIAEALADKFGDSFVRWIPGISYDDGGSFEDERPDRYSEAIAAARNSDVIVVCVGENSYCETPGNLNDLSLSPLQTKFVSELEATGKPVVVILNEGRPRVINGIVQGASAIVDIILPGSYGADALAALLSGEANFSGKLPFTYPKYVNSLHTYDYKVSELSETMVGEYNYDAVMDVQWPFGFGLSYTSFEYSDFDVDHDTFKSGDCLTASVTVKNTGAVAGSETVLLYSSDLVASLVPDSKRLRAFGKVQLQPGESRTVTFALDADDLAFVREDGRWTLEKGDFILSAGGLGKKIYCTETKVWNSQNI